MGVFVWMVLLHEYGSSRKVEKAFEDTRHGPRITIRTAAEELKRIVKSHPLPGDGQ
ncbi:MAG TPA: hypothetical protein VM848_09440 [Acidimicrobiia bacterium]|nr:hypothetical protein [Acidimicrobiia bacterium]